MVMVCFVSLQLVSDSSKVIWSNKNPNSKIYCRSIRIPIAQQEIEEIQIRIMVIISTITRINFRQSTRHFIFRCRRKSENFNRIGMWLQPKKVGVPHPERVSIHPTNLREYFNIISLWLLLVVINLICR